MQCFNAMAVVSLDCGMIVKHGLCSSSLLSAKAQEYILVQAVDAPLLILFIDYMKYIYKQTRQSSNELDAFYNIVKSDLTDIASKREEGEISVRMTRCNGTKAIEMIDM
jgi:hypothetical protein